jgi:hypothetical protein
MTSKGLKVQNSCCVQVGGCIDKPGAASDVAPFCESNCYNLAAHLFVDHPPAPSLADPRPSIHLSIGHCMSFQAHGLRSASGHLVVVCHFLVGHMCVPNSWSGSDREVARLQTDLTAFSELTGPLREGHQC